MTYLGALLITDKLCITNAENESWETFIKQQGESLSQPISLSIPLRLARRQRLRTSENFAEASIAGVGKERQSRWNGICTNASKLSVVDTTILKLLVGCWPGFHFHGKRSACTCFL